MTRVTARVVVQDACAKIVERSGNRRQFNEVREAAQVLSDPNRMCTVLHFPAYSR